MLQLRPFLAEWSLQQSHFQGRRHLRFLDPKKRSSSVALKACCFHANKNLNVIQLHHAKRFMFPAARKVPQCQKRGCHTLPLFAPDKAIPRLLSISILIAGETKNGRAKSKSWSMWQPFFWGCGCDMNLGTPPAASKFHQKQ